MSTKSNTENVCLFSILAAEARKIYILSFIKPYTTFTKTSLSVIADPSKCQSIKLLQCRKLYHLHKGKTLGFYSSLAVTH